MPRKSEVSIHPDKAKIDKALIKGDSYRVIAGRYGVSMTAIGRYMKSKLIPQVSKAQATRELQGGSDLLDVLESYIKIAHKMIKAAEAYLIDPDDIQLMSSLRIIGDPRKLIHYICAKSPEIKLDYTDIAQMVGGKNRTTI